MIIMLRIPACGIGIMQSEVNAMRSIHAVGTTRLSMIAFFA